MAYPIHFDKAESQRYLNSLISGKAIDAPANGQWSINDMLRLAGACFFAAQSHGPPKYWGTGLPAERHQEIHEADDERLDSYLSAAIAMYGHLTMLVKDNEYDDHFEPEVTAIVSQTGDVHRQVKPLKGYKG